MDVVDKETRSRMMSGIRGKDTKPELLVRKGLHSRGVRYRLHAKDLPGRPDIVLPKFNAVIFVHGCFWHGHDCKYFKVPKTRPEFWLEKIGSNRRRDARSQESLDGAGWRVLVVWECAVRHAISMKCVDAFVDEIHQWLMSDIRRAEINQNNALAICLMKE